MRAPFGRASTQAFTYLTFAMVERNVVKGELRATVGLDQAGLKSYIDSGY
jgi:hypothetical protein